MEQWVYNPHEAWQKLGFAEGGAVGSAAGAGPQIDPHKIMDMLTTTHDPVMVGEKGPELMFAPKGSVVVPINTNMKPAQEKKTKKAGVPGKALGGPTGGFDVAPNSAMVNNYLGVNQGGGGGLLNSEAGLKFLGQLAQFGHALALPGTTADRVGAAAEGMVGQAQQDLTSKQKGASADALLNTLAGIDKRADPSGTLNAPVTPVTPAAAQIPNVPILRNAASPTSASPGAAAGVGAGSVGNAGGDSQAEMIKALSSKLLDLLGPNTGTMPFDNGSVSSFPAGPFTVGKLSPQEAMSVLEGGLALRRQQQLEADLPFTRMTQQAQAASAIKDLAPTWSRFESTDSAGNPVTMVYNERDPNKLIQLGPARVEQPNYVKGSSYTKYGKNYIDFVNPKNPSQKMTVEAPSSDPEWGKVEIVNGRPQQTNSKTGEVRQLTTINTLAQERLAQKDANDANWESYQNLLQDLAQMQVDMGAPEKKDSKGNLIFDPNWSPPDIQSTIEESESSLGANLPFGWGAANAAARAKNIAAGTARIKEYNRKYAQALHTYQMYEDGLRKLGSGGFDPATPAAATAAAPTPATAPAAAPNPNSLFDSLLRQVTGGGQ